MRALVFDLSIAKYLLGKAVGGRVRRVYYGPGTCFALRETPAPEPPSDDWVVLAPRLTGFCGSDLSTIFFKMSPVMSAVSLASGESAVLGHEVLADVVSVGSGARGRVKEGDRVVVDPVLGCDASGEVPCTRCAVGEYATCHRFGTGSPKGIMLDTDDQIRIHAKLIEIFAVRSQAMPPGNITEMTPQERLTLASWIAAGEPAK